jgi:hypothetical protein
MLFVSYHCDACSPDWACGLFTIVGTAIDRATNDMIASMKIRDVKDLDDLIKKALEEFGVPVSVTHKHACVAAKLGMKTWRPRADASLPTHILFGLI